ncbi:hypothetical protein PROVRETT_07377 [Providencia rettgeri DSM 1131]|uniref:hypothetical protein n=1 Tax=Providencia TaxID=586 RepID=UPI0001C34594|nr:MULTISPECIES: hypothetical protein [Providencia]EFE53903.1 hypothetical protein PROVRETT_07377 [Providencia rettgeri DSM 1131]QXA59706.1 hypothetical protein I6L79_09475 [Providencia rettgeri]
MTLENNQGGELMVVIRKYIDIEWNRTSRRFVKKYIDPTNFIDGELYIADTINEPPSTNFRPVDERNHQDFIAVLKAAIESYHGKIDWALTGRQKTNTPEYNWAVVPSIFLEQEVIDEANRLMITKAEYLSRKMPELGPVAYADLINLAKHVDKYLEKHYLPLKRHS